MVERAMGRRIMHKNKILLRRKNFILLSMRDGEVEEKEKCGDGEFLHPAHERGAMEEGMQ